MEENNSLISELNEKLTLLEETLKINKIGYWELYLDTNKVKWSDMVYDIHELPRNLDLNKTQGINYYHPYYQEIVSKAIENCIANSEPFNIECILITDKKNEKWVRATGRKNGNKLIGSFQDITDLKNQELKFKGIFNSTFTFIGFLDTNGILLEANDTAVNLAGIKHSDVIGKYFWDCYWWQISKQVQEELKVNFQKALSGEALEYEVVVWIANKTPITILFTLKPIFNENGKVIYIIPEGRPVQELVDTRRRYKSVLEGTNVGTWEWNVQTGGTVFNERWAEIVGYTLEELAPISIETWMKLTHPDDLEESGKKLNACFERKSEFYEFEARMKHKNGHWVWVSDRGKVFEWTKDGKPLLMYGTHEDITERKKNEEKHNRISERLFIATNTSGVGIWDYDVLNNALEWNDIMFQIYGVAKGSFSGAYDAWQNGLHPDDRTQAEKDLQMAISGEKEFDTEFRIVWPDQSIHFIKARAKVQRDATGKAFRIIGTNWDITNQKLAEAEINESNKRNRIFVEQAPHAIAMFDKNMCYLAASQQWVKDYNLSGKQLIGQSHYEIFPEIGDDWKKIHQECLKGAINRVDEAYFERADGTDQWITWDVRPWYISDRDIGGLIMYTADITHIKNKDADKRRIEEILDRTNEVARIGTWEVDLISDKIHWSKVTKEIHDVSQDYEPKLEGAINFFKEGKSRSKIQQAVTEAIDKGTPYDVEVELVTAKGNVIWARAIGQSEFHQGKCKRLYGVFQDIDKVKRAELALNTANEELKAIFNSGYVSIIGTNTEGLITHFNAGAEVLLQYSADEMINLKTPKVLHVKEEVIARGQELTKLLGREISGFDVFVELAKERQYESREWTYVRKDGSTFPVQLIVTAIKNNKNEITGFLGVATDITERKKVENEIRSLLTITEKQNDRLKNFAHIVSHNLRSHSGGISGLIDLLQLEYPDLANNEIITLLSGNVASLKQTVEDLTEIIKINLTNQELKHIQLSTIIEKNLNSLSSQINRAGIRIINETPKTIRIQGITAYVDSIVLNMITNAIKYKSEERESFLRIYCEEDKTTLSLYFQDNGLGIDLNKHRDKLFGMYKTFHRHNDSRGMGLFITKNQIESIGGKISVESEVNIGTTFKIIFKK